MSPLYWYSILRRFKPRLSLLTQNDIFYKANNIRQNLKFISCFILSPPRVESWREVSEPKAIQKLHIYFICMLVKWAGGMLDCQKFQMHLRSSANVKSSGRGLTFAFIQVTSLISNLKHCSSRRSELCLLLPKGHRAQVGVRFL